MQQAGRQHEHILPSPPGGDGIQWSYLATDGSTKGPYSTEQLSRLFDTNAVTSATYVFAAGKYVMGACAIGVHEETTPGANT